MRRFSIFLVLLAAAYMDIILFARLNIAGIRPDATLAVIISLGVLTGPKPAAITGGVCGLLLDVLFGKLIGLSAIGYMISGAIAGLFYNKYYADNVIIPAAMAIVGALVKEHVMMLALTAAGAAVNYGEAMAGYVLPCALMTGLLGIPLHLLLKQMLARQVKRRAERV